MLLLRFTRDEFLNIIRAQAKSGESTLAFHLNRRKRPGAEIKCLIFRFVVEIWPSNNKETNDCIIVVLAP